LNFYKINKIASISLGTLFLISGLYGSNYETDPATNLVIDKGFDTVVENCLTCHPSDIIVDNRKKDRKSWLELIKKMQTTVCFLDLGPAAEKKILDYLEKHYTKTQKKELVPNLNLDNIK